MARSFLERNLLPYLALYQTLQEEGIDREAALAEVGGLLWKDFARAARGMTLLLGALPDGIGFGLFRRLTLLDVRLRFPSPHWQADVVENSVRALAMNSRRCFTLDVLTAYGAPELAAVIAGRTTCSGRCCHSGSPGSGPRPSPAAATSATSAGAGRTSRRCPRVPDS